MIRNTFVKKFGESQAIKIEYAAMSHKNGINDRNYGKDRFKWALLICIGYECISKYRDYHGITIPYKKLKKWIVDNARLDLHDGDCDYISLAAGIYNEFMPKKQVRKVTIERAK